MRILFLNRCYGPNQEATGQILHQLCETMATIAGDDLQLEVVAGRTRDGKIENEGYSPSIPVTRVRHTRFEKSSRLGRLFNLFSYAFMSFIASLFRSRPDVVITLTDPFFLPPLGLFLKYWHRCRYIAYLQDIYPDVAVVVGEVKENFVVRVIRRVLFFCIRRADQVIVLSQDMIQTCIDNGVKPERIHVIENWSDTSKIVPIKDENSFRQQHTVGENFLVMYSGNMGRAHLLEPLIVAAEKLKDHPSITFMFVGEGAQKPMLANYAQDKGLTNVTLLPYQPLDQLATSLSAADLHVVSLLPGAERCLMPSKIYGIMSSGTAMLAICKTDCELATLVNTEQIGAVCDVELTSEDLANEIAAQILDLSRNRQIVTEAGSRARKVAVDRYDVVKQAAKFLSLLDKTSSLHAANSSR